MNKKLSSLIALSLAGLLLRSLPAAAADGVLEINQTCATQTGCFTGDAAGFPVTLAAAGSYRLTSNLQVPDANTTAVDITSGSVVLDLGGFSILGVTTCSGVPVTSCSPTGSGRGVNGAFGARDVVVRNGEVSGMGSDGVSLDFSARAEGLHVFLNGGDGITVANESLVSGNVVTSNFGDGLRCQQRCVVRGNTSTGNRLNGIQLTSGTVTGNSSTSDGQDGGAFGEQTAYAQNLFSANAGSDVSGGHATGGNICGDGSCTTHGERQYYLSKLSVTGAGASTECAPGYHMASLYEILDPSRLEYDSARGSTASDSGSGPVTNSPGWVRTGVSGAVGSPPPGIANCAAWTDPSGSNVGTHVALDESWQDGNPGSFGTDVPPWRPGTSTCDLLFPVWCVEN